MVSCAIKVCFIGLGSIGNRHLNNIKKYSYLNNIDLIVHAMRTSFAVNGINTQLVDKEVYSFDDLDNDFDIIFITNPTSLHFDTIASLTSKCKNMFIEKPIFENIDYDISNIDFKTEGIYYVAAPMRFTDVYLYLKENIDSSHVLSSRIICSSYMPNWQKGRDYRRSFRAYNNMGGGVDIDLIHEIDYMVDLFGKPKAVFRTVGKYSNLEMDACDLAMYQFIFTDKVVQVSLDYFGRFDKREIELYTNNEVIIGDFINKEIRYPVENRTITFSKEVDHYYREMEYFMSLILDNNKENINTVSNAFSILKFSKGVI